MAFEDAVVLCRCISKLFQKSLPDMQPTKQQIEQVLKEYENTRLPRVRKLWYDQWDRSEKAYKNEVSEPWSKEFSDWVHTGV